MNEGEMINRVIGLLIIFLIFVKSMRNLVIQNNLLLLILTIITAVVIISLREMLYVLEIMIVMKQKNVKTMEDFKKIMRQNNYQHDPLSEGNPKHV